MKKICQIWPKEKNKITETQKVCFSLFHFRNEPFFLVTVTQFDKSCFGNETNWNKLLGLLDPDQKTSAKFGPKKNTKKSETQKVCFSLFHFRNEPFFFGDSYTV